MSRFYPTLLAGMAAFAFQNHALGAPGGATRNGSNASLQEVNVQLFGQPCLLAGPFPEEVLKSIHAVSPEKNPPPESAALARQFKQRVSAERKLPEELDRYRERLAAHFEARAVFFEGFQAAQKSGQLESLYTATKAQIPQSRLPAFKKRVDSLGKKPADWREEDRDALLLEFFDFAPALPEAEFHRAIRALEVSYICTFDEEEGGRPDSR